MRVVFTAMILLLAACGQPDNPKVQVLIGGELLDGKNSPPLDHPIVVIEEGKIAAVGPQAHVPVPRGSRKTDTTGYRIRPSAGRTIETGQPADLELVDSKGEVSRRMVAGVWQ